MKRVFLIATVTAICLAIGGLTLHFRADAQERRYSNWVGDSGTNIAFTFVQGDANGEQDAKEACRVCNAGRACSLIKDVRSWKALENECVANNSTTSSNDSNQSVSKNSQQNSTNNSNQSQESSATLEETLSFLEDFLASNGNLLLSGDERKSGLISRKLFFTSVNRCNVKITEERKNKGSKSIGDGTAYSVFTFSLSDIDPSSIKPTRIDTLPTESSNNYRSFLFLNTRNNKDAITWTYWTAPLGDDKPNIGQIPIIQFEINELPSGKNQTRINTALKHAIELCGGKSSPF